jgi:hypothetical protein
MSRLIGTSKQLSRTPASIQPGCVSFVANRQGSQIFKLSKQVYGDPLQLCKLQKLDVVVTNNATSATNTYLRLRVGNTDNVNTARDTKSPAADYSDYLTIPIPPTSGGQHQVLRIELDLTLGHLFVGKQLPIDLFFTSLIDQPVPFNDVVGTDGAVVVFLEHGVQ